MPRADQLFEDDSQWLNCMVHKDPNMPNLTWKLVARGMKMGGDLNEGTYKMKLHLKGRMLFMGLDCEVVGD